MATIVFVHGTGVRKAAYESSLALFEAELYKRVTKQQADLMPCLWGNSLGVHLNVEGKSIPNYDATRPAPSGEETKQENLNLLWEMLAYDSLYELHGLAMEPETDSVPFEALDNAVSKLPPDSLKPLLADAGIATVFAQALTNVRAAPAFANAIAAAQSKSELYDPISRAIVAEAMTLVSVAGDAHATLPIFLDAQKRDAVVSKVAAALGSPTLGVLDWTANKLFGVAKRLGADRLIQKRRGQLMDGITPFIGDIFLYQARGQEMRAFIKTKIQLAAQKAPPVVVVGHSLGGIACVDLLMLENLPEVRTLITVGSQAPYFYELNALQSLRYGEPIKPHFPNWLNIYDPRDLLSFVGEPVFPARAQGVGIRDIAVDNRTPFPDAHSAYWNTDAVWRVVQGALPT